MSYTWDELEQHPQPGGGNLYTLRGRAFITCNRCELCGDMGIYEDTRCCHPCEEDALRLAPLIRTARGESAADPRLPDITGRCRTTHTACPCILQRLREQEREIARLRALVTDYQQQLGIDASPPTPDEVAYAEELARQGR